MPIWREVAPRIPVRSIDQAAPSNKCLVFDADSGSIAQYRQWREDCSRIVLSFFTEYYPSVCARTFAPGTLGKSIGNPPIFRGFDK